MVASLPRLSKTILIAIILTTAFVYYKNMLNSRSVQTIVNIFYDSKTFTLNDDDNKQFETSTNTRAYHVTRLSTVLASREEEQSYFVRCWRLQHDMRTNYERIQAPCRYNMSWQPFDINRKRERASARYSEVSMDIQPAGQYSKVLIRSYDWLNFRRKVGGDTWRIHVRGTTSVPVTVVDNMDGSYEAIFLITEPGFYEVRLYLDYSLCDGYKDPPPDWFVKGNEQGKHQSQHALPDHHNAKPFLEEKFLGNLVFTVTENNKLTIYEEMKNKLEVSDPKQSCYMWDGFGRWKNNSWHEYMKDSYKKSLRKHAMAKGTLWIFGDSVGDFLYRSIVRTPLCARVFSSCKRTYYWSYKIEKNNISAAMVKDDNRDFDIDRILRELKDVLKQPELRDENSALVLNYGLHYAMEIPYWKFQEMMTKIIHLLIEEQRNGFLGRIIWKTTTALWKWRWGCRNVTSRHATSGRFLTTARVELFNAYSTSKMCEAGIDVLDIYPMSFSYPKGTRSLCDAVHYNNIVFKPVEEYLYKYFSD